MSWTDVRRFGRRRWVLMGAALTGLVGFVWWFHSLAPARLFNDPYSTVIEDRNGALLGASIAADGQWRFPERRRVPDQFKTALIQFEDRRFEQHPGVDPVAVLRAAKENVSAGRVVSGGSTLTMQLVRLARKGRPRTLSEKVIEAFTALRLERVMDKDQILAAWASHAPFGGNVVGLDAAAWRYFGRPPAELTYAESALLAVLPNAPALMHPGRNRDVLKAKRDGLLARLREIGVLDQTTYALAVAEPLPRAPHPLPRLAPHLLDRVAAEHGQVRLRTSLDAGLQHRAVAVMARYSRALLENNVRNGAALIIDNHSGQVLAYVGNTGDADAGGDGRAVDIVTAPRSTGSLLKPFLYAAGLDAGLILPKTLQLDVPISYAGYAPKNFDRTFSGLTPADEALAHSLNVPAVGLLKAFGVPQFHHVLTHRLGLSTLPHHPDHYGLALILGGAEGTLWELAGLYSGLANTLNRYQTDGTYAAGDFAPPTYGLEDVARGPGRGKKTVFSAGAVWFTTEALVQLERGEGRRMWRHFESARRVAWKTGTSFGFRDAWAVGYTPEATVAVWFGNADGEGRPGLTGSQTAAPAMFELFELLEAGRPWFRQPGDMARVETCAQSGYRAGAHCPERQTQAVPNAGLRTGPCPFHQLLHLDAEGRRVTDACTSPSEMDHRPWFVLPPGPAWFYTKNHPEYQPPPPFRKGCGQAGQPMALISPRETSGLFIPLELNGLRGKVVFEAAHREQDKVVYWHLDETYLGQTRRFHRMALAPPPGPHLLTLVDEDGMAMKRRIQVLEVQP